MTIIDAVRKKGYQDQKPLFHWFETKDNNPPIREAIEFYKHPQGWSNRLIAGDSLLVMNSLLEKEGMAGKVQMIYIDPPYGIKYGSNFQPFVNKKDVKDGKDEDLTQEPETIKAFRDTWELGIHSYLTYLRDRILLARELLAESGSCFVQISDDNIHHVREIMDEVFGSKNFISQIFFKKTSGAGSPGELIQLASVGDYLLWYAKDFSKKKFRQLFVSKGIVEGGAEAYKLVKLPDGTVRSLTKEELSNPKLIGQDWKIFRIDNLTSQSGVEKTKYPVMINDKEYRPNKGVWKTSKEGMNRLVKAGRVHVGETSLGYIRYLDDFPAILINNIWDDTTISGSSSKIYVVQTNQKVIDRCILLTTDPSDLVLDITCGSGTTAQSAEQWGRRWITCDTSRVSITLAKQRLMTAIFDYYKLSNPKEVIAGAFNYARIPHITLRSIANAESPEKETLYDRPLIDRSKMRVTGPFTVEAVPSPYVKSFEEVPIESEADQTLSRSGETLRQGLWRSEIIKAGIRGKGGQQIEFSRVETLSGAKWLHADAETKEKEPKRVVISFGPDYAPLEQRQVELGTGRGKPSFP